MGTYLGLDVGDKRIGIAILESSIGIGFPQPAVQRAGALAHLQALVRARAVEQIVVGVPLMADGKMTSQGKKVLAFVEQLSKHLCAHSPSVRVLLVDEHLSSEDASERLREVGKSVQDARRSGELDSLVAALLVQGYHAGEIPELRLPNP